MHLRVARHTERLDEVVAFYRDGLGFSEIGGFRDHNGYDGVFLALPGTQAAPPPRHVASGAVLPNILLVREREIVLRAQRIRGGTIAPFAGGGGRSCD